MISSRHPVDLGRIAQPNLMKIWGIFQVMAFARKLNDVLKSVIPRKKISIKFIWILISSESIWRPNRAEEQGLCEWKNCVWSKCIIRNIVTSSCPKNDRVQINHILWRNYYFKVLCSHCGSLHGRVSRFQTPNFFCAGHQAGSVRTYRGSWMLIIIYRFRRDKNEIIVSAGHLLKTLRFAEKENTYQELSLEAIIDHPSKLTF